MFKQMSEPCMYSYTSTYTKVRKFGFFNKKLLLLFSKDAFNWSKSDSKNIYNATKY